MNENQKQSLILGGLASSAGVFITKVIGILYVIPFSAMASEANLSYYARAYNVYEMILNVSIAGLPLAIATMVAKYMLKEQYKTVLLVRRLSTAILAVLGFVSMIGLFFLALPIARISISGPVDSVEVMRTRNVMMIMALAVFSVPLLNSWRGFYQGLKELNIYAFSQVLEQLARVAFLLGIGFLLVVIFGYDRMWAVYAAIASTSVSAVVSIIYFVLKDRKKLKEIKELARTSQEEVPSSKAIAKELFYFSIPFLLNVVLNSMSNFVNLLFFNQAMILHGETIQSSDLYYSLVMFTTNKLTSIPQVVAPGFVTAIIPYVTTSFEKKDFNQMRQYVLDTINTVFYLTLPLAFFLLGISAPIYYVMYGKENVALGAEVLSLNSFTGLTFNMASVSNALMMALRLRKQNLIVLVVTVVFAAVTFVPMVAFFGYQGSIYSKLLTQISMFIINLYLIKRTYQVSYKQVYRNLSLMIVGLIGMELVFLFLDVIGLKVVDQSRLIATLELAVYGVLGLSAYFAITSWFKLPQTILHFNVQKILAKFRRKPHAS